MRAGRVFFHDCFERLSISWQFTSVSYWAWHVFMSSNLTLTASSSIALSYTGNWRRCAVTRLIEEARWNDKLKAAWTTAVSARTLGPSGPRRAVLEFGLQCLWNCLRDCRPDTVKSRTVGTCCYHNRYCETKHQPRKRDGSQQMLIRQEVHAQVYQYM